MAWTESRSRDEWLAEVRRRGERLRRRRQIAVALVGALALVLPATALSTFIGGDPDRRDVQLSAAGPAPAGERAGGGAGPDAAVEAPGEPAPAEETVTTTTVWGPAPDDVPRRVGPETPVRDFVAPASPASIPPADDPVVRPPATVPPVQGNTPPTLPSTQTTSRSASATPAATLGSCRAESLQIDVVPTKATFAAGETVQGMFFVQTAGAGDCLVAMPTSFRIEVVGTGAVVGSVAATSEAPNPVRADGTMYTSTFSWDQRECSGSTCTQVPAGLYQAVAQWSEATPYRGWGEFRIGG